MASCPHVAALQPANAQTKLHKDECVLCFDDVTDKGGLDVCLTTFKGLCVGPLNHSYQHRERTGLSVFLNIKRLYKPKQMDKEITSLEIGGEGGARMDDMKGSYEHFFTLHCYSCNLDLDYESDPQLKKLVDAVKNLDSESNKSDVQAWKQEILPCEHTLTLQQLPGASKLGAKGMSHCGMCDLDKNLWLCLTCGHLGCGRQLMEIGTNINLGGNGHALDHHNASGHPFCVKIGTITPKGEADLYCYACDNDVKDLELEAHLAYFGIVLSAQSKTEKTIAEMSLEQNLRANLFSSKENGKVMKSVFGPGLTGVNNIGNSCYMASVLQCISAIPAFRQRYSPDNQHSASCGKHPAECYHCQMEKLFDGMHSGRYSCIRELQRLPADKGEEEKEEEAKEKEKEKEEKKEVEEEQRGVTPRMLKKLICRDHIDFGGMQQQDAYEFFQFFIKAVQRSEKASGGGKKDPSKVFNLTLEQRNECNQCHHVRYSTVDQTELKLGIPLEFANPPLDAKEGETKDQVEERESISTVSFEKCLQSFRQPESVRGFNCSICKSTTSLSQSTLISKFPKILMTNVTRFTYDGWVNEARKLFVNVGFEDVVDFATIAAPPHPEGEKLFPDDQQGGPSVNQEWVDNLSAMGFEADVCAYAIEETGSAGMEQALNWLFEHGNSPDTMAAIAARKNQGKKKSGAPPVNEFAVEMICSMGFSKAQAVHALGETSGDAERAADWLFNHPDFVPPEEGPAEEEEGEGEGEGEDDGRPPLYELFGVVQHRGTSIGSGHYVAYLRTDGGWVQFNDSKVTESLTPPIGQGYIYFFKKK